MTEYSFKQYTANGVDDTFAFTFGYLSASHISVTVDGVAVDFTFPSASSIQTDVIAASGIIEIRRSTPVGTLAGFSNTSTLTDAQLRTATLQALYLSAEAFDNASNAILVDVDGHFTANSKRLKDLAAPVGDNDAVRKADLDAATLVAGNVPTPADPGDDGKELVAGSGVFAWTTKAVTSAQVSDSSAAGRAVLTAADAAAQRTELGLVIGTDVLAPTGDGSALAGLPGANNLLINGDFGINRRAPTSNADDSYGHDRWYALTQTGAVAVATLTDVEDGLPRMARLTQSQAGAQRMGYAQIVAGENCKHLRGQQVTLRFRRFRCSAAQAIRFAVLEWTGTEDAVTSDVVNDWADASYAAGAFFLASDLTVSGVASETPAADTLTDMTKLTVTLGSSFNNLVVLVWTEDTAAQNVTLDLGEAQLEAGANASAFERRAVSAERALCDVYFRKIGGSTAARYGAARTTGTTSGELIFPLVTAMRAAPTVSAVNITNWRVNDAAVNAAVSSVSSTSTAADTVNINVACATVTANRPAFFGVANANAFFFFDAEL